MDELYKASEWMEVLEKARQIPKGEFGILEHGDGAVLKEALRNLYGEKYGEERDHDELMRQSERLSAMVAKYIELYGDSEIIITSSPGRAELIGNYQDNLSLGHTISAAISRDVVAVAGKNDGMLKVHDMKLADTLDMKVEMLPKAGQCAPHQWHNFAIGIGRQMFDSYGFGGEENKIFRGAQIVVDGEVPLGSGCSSSAAFENSLVYAITMLHELPLNINMMATMSKNAENQFQGKGCGFLDQITSLVGGIVYINYSNPSAPSFSRLPKFFQQFGLVTVMVDEGHGKDDALYNTIKPDLEATETLIADSLKHGDGRYLQILDSKSGMADRTSKGYDRARFYVEEYYRVCEGIAHLVSGTERDAHLFGQAMSRSGEGSRTLLGNTNEYIDKAVKIARENGWYARVHGGGFKGGPIIMTPNSEMTAELYKDMHGKDKVLVHRIRDAGTCEISFHLNRV